MQVHYDQLRRSDAAGNTVVVSFAALTGSPSVDTDFPLTNIYDSTSTNSKNESFYLQKFTRINFVQNDEFEIRIDLGAAQSGSAGLLSGFRLNSDSGTVIKDITLQSSPNGTGWTTMQVINRSLGGADQWTEAWGTTGTPQIAFTGTTMNRRYWRFLFDTQSAGGGFIDIGYASVYGDGFDLGINTPNITQVSTNTESVGKTGTPFIVSNGQYRLFPVNLPIQNGDKVAFVSQLSRGEVNRLTDVQEKISDGTITNDFVDPSNWPTLGVFNFDITDGNSNSEIVKRSIFSTMAIVDRSLDWSFNYHPNNPQTGVTFREWV